MIKGRRITDLSNIERKQFYDFVDAHKDDKNIISLIYDKFGVEYSPSSRRYLNKLCGRKSELDRLANDNEKMLEWNNFNKVIDVNYADLLSDLANNIITQNEFNSLVEK